MANKAKHNKVFTVIYVVIVVLVLVAVVGVIVHFTRNNQTPPAEEGTLSVSIDGNAVQSGSSVGVISNNAEITVDGVSEFSVAVYAYSSADNDFEFTVDGETYSWGGINNRNMTKGFTIEQTAGGIKISYGGIEQIISAVQYGAEVAVGDLPDGDIFRLSVTAGEEYSDIYFSLLTGVILDKTEIIF